MKNKIKVAVLMGGKSPEHEISVLSGQQVVKNLNKKKYEILPVVISKDGTKWQLTSVESILSLKNPINLKGTKTEIVIQNKKELTQESLSSEKGIDVVFIAIHGPFGEDGTIQDILEASEIPYTGSGILASSLGMDKAMFRKVMVAEKIDIPKYVVVDKNDKQNYIFESLGKPPYFVKPSDQGSSVGSSFVKTKKDLARALKIAFKYSDMVLVDEYIKGLEVTCAVIGNDKPIALPITEIHPLKGDFFDYESKYSGHGSEEITPARVSMSLTKKIQKLSIDVYKAIGCRGFGRVDFIIKNRKSPVVLEINTVPGLTSESLLPKAAKAAGINYPELLDTIIKYATEKN
jgi:D-alanine-D-alanine ligase